MRKARRRSVLPGFGLSLGYTLMYLSLIVLIPLAAVFIKAATLSWPAFVQAVASPRVLASYKLTFGASLLAAAINVVFGFLLAWSLVRYDFPGRRFIDALVDLPFALPTAVAGIALTALYAKNGWLGYILEPLGIKVAFTPLGVGEYCTLTVDAKYRRTMTETLEVKAGGRVAFYPAGTLEVAKLKESQLLPYKKDAAVPCRGDAPISFRTDGNVATCILDQESLFVSALKTKKKVSSTCQSGGLIAVDEDGIFNGCYPPPPAKPAAPDKTKTQGGQNQ